jgi:hypothetical protein
MLDPPLYPMRASTSPWTARPPVAESEAGKARLTQLWIGGHGISPYEQKTQQSPFLGFICKSHCLQAQGYWQASVGIPSVERCPHVGHVIADRSSIMAF